MFDDGYVAAEQHRVDWPALVRCIVDIVRINPDDPRASISEMNRGGFRQIRMAIEITFRVPVPGPVRVNEHRPATDVDPLEHRSIDSTPAGAADTNDDAIDIGDGRQ